MKQGAAQVFVHRGRMLEKPSDERAGSSSLISEYRMRIKMSMNSLAVAFFIQQTATERGFGNHRVLWANNIEAGSNKACLYKCM